MTGAAYRYRPFLLVLGLLYAASIVYGSLIPFQVRPMTWEAAWAGFWAMPYLDLGAASRADWVANLILYVPLSFLLLGAMWPRDGRASRIAAASAVLVFCFALAVAVEFVQQFFAPRTVSQNDLLAEGLGALIGIIVWWGYGPTLLTMASDVARSGASAPRAAFRLYGLALILVALFPFDFVVSGRELDQRLANIALWHVAGFDRSLLHGTAELLAPLLAYAPLGALAALSNRRASLGSALALGLGLAAFLEVAQLFVFSAVTSVISVIAAGAGTAIGFLAVRFADRVPAWRARHWLRVGSVVAVPPYLVALLILNDVRPSGLLSPGQVVEALSRVSFTPFYYHYFTTEVQAMASVLSRLAMYAPIGMMFWAWRGASSTDRGALASLLLGGVVAAAMETGRLITGARPDPTNVLIGAVAAGSGFILLRAMMRGAEIWRTSASSPAPHRPDPTGNTRASTDPVRQTTATADPVLPSAWRMDGPRPSIWRLLIAAGLLACVAAALLRFPINAGWLALLLGAYGCLVWLRPLSWLAGLPAAMVALDFAPYSGRFFFDEFDFVVLATLAVLVVRQPLSWRSIPAPGSASGVVIILLVLSYGIGTNLLGLAGQPITVNSFNSYYSPFNALRVAKGFFWALLLLPFLADAFARQGEAAFRWLTAGMALGLAWVALATLVERSAFIHPLNFDSAFRVTAGLSSMHIGGGHLAGFMLLAMPFLAALPRAGLGRIGWLIALLVFALASYALLMTFQRAAYAAFASAFAVLVVGLWTTRRSGRGRAGPAVLGLGAAAVIAAALLSLVLGGQTIRDRFETLEADFLIREANWHMGLSMRDSGPIARLFGEGIGSYPLVYLLRNPQGVTPTTFAIEADDGDRFLRLGSGGNQYFEQRVTVRPGETYTLGLSIRDARGGTLSILLCEKSLLYSFRCQILNVVVPVSADWQEVSQELTIPLPVASDLRSVLLAPPRTLALFVREDGAVMDIDSIRLVDEAGRDVIANGDFSRGTDRWFFSDDNHLIWRIHNQFLMTLFEQGWFGLVSLLSALTVALSRLLRRLPVGDQRSAILLASLVGFLSLWITESPLEAPRLGFAFYLLLFVSLLLDRSRRVSDAV